MRDIHVSDEVFDHLENVVIVRQASGIDPVAVNDEMATFLKHYQSTRAAKSKLIEHLKMGTVMNPAEEFDRDYRNDLQTFQNRMVAELLGTYQVTCMPNAYLDAIGITAKMRKQLGSLGFDAFLIENEVAKCYARRRVMSYITILSNAKLLCPDEYGECPTGEAKIMRMLDGRKLWLRLNVRFNIHNKIVEIRLPCDKRFRIESLHKLSQVLLLGRDPATVNSNICDAISLSNITGPGFPINVQGARPMEELAFQSDGKLVVTYETAEQARRVAERLAKVRC